MIPCRLWVLQQQTTGRQSARHRSKRVFSEWQIAVSVCCQLMPLVDTDRRDVSFSYVGASPCSALNVSRQLELDALLGWKPM